MSPAAIATEMQASTVNDLRWECGPVVVHADGSASFDVLAGTTYEHRGRKSTPVRVMPHTVTINADGSQTVSR